MGTFSAFDDHVGPGNPLGDSPRERTQQLVQQTLRFCVGELSEQEMAQLPWQDAAWRTMVVQHLKSRAGELEKHRVRFNALREVFGPGK